MFLPPNPIGKTQPGNTKKGAGTMHDIPKSCRSHLLLLCIIRTIVKKHGGNLQINEKSETFTVSIPESRKAECFRELRETIGPFQQVCDSPDYIQ
jgi:hypothetical protein